MLPSAGQDSETKASRKGNSACDRLWRRTLGLLVGSEGLAAYDHGRFRNGGEVHKWMYDRYSLLKVLESAGFTENKRVGLSESRVANWSGFNLDTEADGSTYKPDSLSWKLFGHEDCARYLRGFTGGRCTVRISPAPRATSRWRGIQDVRGVPRVGRSERSCILLS